MTMKECSFEKSASAMNLIDEEKISFSHNDFTNIVSIITEYSIRIKIFNKLGYSAANIKIPFLSNSRYSSLSDVRAYLYSLDSTGKIVKEKLNNKEILRGTTKEKDAENYVAFAFPNLQPGDIIEYKYTRTDKGAFYILPWFFQSTMPTAVSRVTTVVPTYKKVTYYVLASQEVVKDSTYRKYEGALYNEITQSFTMRNVHSFHVEPMMTSVKDNLQRVEFAMPGFIYRQAVDGAQKMRFYTYDLLNDWSFGLQIKKPIQSLDHFIDSVKQFIHKTETIEAIYQLVRKNVEWNGEQVFFCDDSVAGCWNTKSGSSAEMNLLFLNLLRKAGIKCNPILISTHNNGSPDMEFSDISQFNGVDVLIMDSGSKYVVDCTQKDLSYVIPPYNVLNSFGFVVDPDFMGWMLIMDHRILMKTIIEVNAVMDSTGYVRGSTETSNLGYSKADRLQELRGKKVNKVEPELMDHRPDLISDTLITAYNNEHDDSLVVKESFHFKSPASGNFYFINPQLFSVFSRNPFIENIRYSDIDFGSSQSFITEIRIKTPLNVSVEGLPKDIALYKKDSAISFVRTIVFEKNSLLIRSQFVMKNAIFIKEDYADVKGFFDKFYSLMNGEVILKKN